jgi:hypothetical protein
MRKDKDGESKSKDLNQKSEKGTEKTKVPSYPYAQSSRYHRKSKESITGEPDDMSRLKSRLVQPACAVTRPRLKDPDMLYNPRTQR